MRADAKPIILVIDGAAIKLAVDEVKCGVYIESENDEQIAEKMRFYKSSPQIAKEHGGNGYKYVCENYDRRKLAARYIELMDKRIVNKQAG
jgi:glycosyltransferase involved in cell wall biosynthesis